MVRNGREVRSSHRSDVAPSSGWWYDAKQLPVQESCALLDIGKTLFYRFLQQIEVPQC
jgi:hypothetical protein